MVEKVTGFLARDGKFFTDEVLCRHHDARLAILNKNRNSLHVIAEQQLEDFMQLVDSMATEIMEYLIAREAILYQEEKQDDPDQRPITVEE